MVGIEAADQQAEAALLNQDLAAVLINAASPHADIRSLAEALRAAPPARQAALLEKIREGQRDQWHDLLRGIAPTVARRLGTDAEVTLAANLDALR